MELQKSLYFRPALLVFWISDIELCQPKAWNSLFSPEQIQSSSTYCKIAHSYCRGCFWKMNITLPFITIKPSVTFNQSLAFPFNPKPSERYLWFPWAMYTSEIISLEMSVKIMSRKRTLSLHLASNRESSESLSGNACWDMLAQSWRAIHQRPKYS